MTTKRFHLGDVLSITHDRLVSPRHMDGIYDICNWLTQDNLFTHQLPRVHEECRAALLMQHPQLNEIAKVTDEDVDILKRSDPEWWESWLDRQIDKFGEYLDVQPIPQGIHEYKDPISEAVDMFGKDRVVVMNNGGRQMKYESSLNECLLKERRRYALLEAATIIYTSINPELADLSVNECVEKATQLLTEIERREGPNEEHL